MAGLVTLTLAYVMSQFYRSFLAVLTPALIDELGATKGELSAASGAWFAGFALAQFAVGVSLDRYGPRRTAALLLGICGGGGAVLFAFATTPGMIIAAMGLIGIGCAPVLMSSAFIFAHTYSPARLAILISWYVGIGSAGNVIGASPLANAAEAFGWRGVIAVLAGLTVLVAAAILVFVNDPAKAEDDASGGGFSGYLELIRIRALWPLIPLVALNYAPAVGIRGLWAGPYLADVYGADAIAIGRATLFMAFAMVAGSIVYGPLDSLFGTRKWVAVIGNALGAATLVYLVADPTPGIWGATLIFVLIGVFGGSYGLLMAHGRAFLPSHLTGRGMTLLNFFSIGGVGLVQFATGPVYSAGNATSDPVTAYTVLFGFYAALLIVAVLIYLFSREAKPEPKDPVPEMP